MCIFSGGIQTQQISTEAQRAASQGLVAPPAAYPQLVAPPQAVQYAPFQRPISPYGPPPIPFGNQQIPYGVPPAPYSPPFIPQRPRSSERSHAARSAEDQERAERRRRSVERRESYDREPAPRSPSREGRSYYSPVETTRRYISVVKRYSSGTAGGSKSKDNMVDQATLDKLEAGFKKLQNAKDCKSLLKKYLTKDVFEKLKTRKTAMGATLLDIIQSGVENLDSGVGLYAPDAESYTLFADLFNPVIEDYHGGFKSTDKHPPTDFGDLNTLVDVDPDNQFVISTRVRCGRSLQARLPVQPVPDRSPVPRDGAEGELDAEDAGRRAEGHLLPAHRHGQEDAAAAHRRPLPLQGRGPLPAGGQRVPLLAHGPGHLPQRRQDLPGLVQRGGPPAHHLDAEGRRPPRGVRPPGQGRQRHREEAAFLPRQPPGLPDLLPDQPGHHHPGQRAHQGAQAGRRQGAPRQCRRKVQPPGSRHPWRAHRERGRRLRHLQQAAHGPDRVPGSQGDAGRYPGAHPSRKGGLSSHPSPTQTQRTTFPTPTRHPHCPAPPLLRAPLFFLFFFSRAAKKFSSGGDDSPETLLLVNSCKQIFSLLVSFSCEKSTLCFLGPREGKRIAATTFDESQWRFEQ
ncbi:unnamed protein product [Ixodes hexagonus]